MAPIINVSNEVYQAIKTLGIEHTLAETKQAEIPASDFWTIPNVSYRGNASPWDLFKKLLPSRTQQQHAEHRNSVQEVESVTADMPLYHAIFNALFEQKDALEFAESARKFIQGAIRQRFPNTLTRIAYPTRAIPLS